ncbi:MAG TPA: hypothetical protein VG096_23940 [Bryobacteraceae bacterium]|nr:hypothetical protein [Bryobacteraceae bacterium]
MAQSFQQAATNLQNLAQQNDVQFRDTVDQVNQIVGQIQAYNHTAMETGTAAQDSGVDAQVHSALQNLSQFISFTASRQPDGTTTILMNGSPPFSLEIASST